MNIKQVETRKLFHQLPTPRMYNVHTYTLLDTVLAMNVNKYSLSDHRYLPTKMADELDPTESILRCRAKDCGMS